MKKYLFFALAALSLGFAACNDKNEPSSKSEVSITVNPSSKTVSALGETFSVEITSSSAWTATTDQPSWVSLNPLAGAGDAYVSITVSAGGEGTAIVNFDNVSGKSATLTIVREAGSSVPGALSGEFSVSATTKVHFSQGNLQYRASTNTWQFAQNQYDIIGESNSNISSTYSGWIDLFGWGTSGYNGSYPYMTSNRTYYGGYSDNDIAGTNYDWGVYNKISNGGNQANMWRTLTRDEWEYLFNTRTDAAKLFGKGVVNGVNGTILLPDNWAGTKFSDTGYGQITAHYTQVGWERLMEPAGAVFLPAAGYRILTDVKFVGSSGIYWSATSASTDCAYEISFSSSGLSSWSYFYRYHGYSVRLVR